MTQVTMCLLLPFQPHGIAYYFERLLRFRMLWVHARSHCQELLCALEVEPFIEGTRLSTLRLHLSLLVLHLGVAHGYDFAPLHLLTSKITNECLHCSLIFMNLMVLTLCACVFSLPFLALALACRVISVFL